ncbi:hypothetical protein PTTG_08791 [Puccinia triticina 1-1 BBBD Race 1]|uniref:BZIP domain-containing protein n=1 Tax=Puccinia triticina (isolate 1-1 / race 1 (BBBD)) TaxID=630390 RepID=A0A180G871_PUCT1|nr:hypothetical protein PTTG_08791 [Puccinia triticina 1-1 BBBD Race 1]
MSTLRSGSPTPSASNSDHSLAKRKPDDGHNPKPAKISRPASIQELPFDPFSPHPGMSKEERKLARMIRNRTAAQASRDRKKEHVAELENRVRELEEQLRILSRPPPAMPCLRPCCQQAAGESAGKPSGPASPPQPASWSALSPDSIDPSIIQPSPAAPSPSPETDKKIDPQLNRTADHHPSPTISPAQAEYLSKVRIHVLEEENSQLRSQLAYELKKAQLPPLSAPDEHRPQGSSSAIEIDQGMIEMILKDDEIDKSLHSPSPAQLLSPSDHLPQPTPTYCHHHHHHHHPDELSQLSMDWDSLLLDRPAPSPSSSPTTDRPTSKEHRDSSHDDDRFETMMTMAAMDDTRWNQGTWPSPSGSPSDPRPPTLAPTRPETPPPDQQPQAPAERALSALSPAAHPVPPAPHPRLVAREDSLQRNGGSAGRTARPDSSRRAPCVSPVSTLCRPLMAVSSAAPACQPLLPALFLLLLRAGPGWLGRRTSAETAIMACCLISCWVAWESRTRPTVGPRPTSAPPVPTPSSSTAIIPTKKTSSSSTTGASSASLSTPSTPAPLRVYSHPPPAFRVPSFARPAPDGADHRPRYRPLTLELRRPSQPAPGALRDRVRRPRPQPSLSLLTPPPFLSFLFSLSL